MRSAAFVVVLLLSLVVLFSPQQQGDQLFPQVDKVVHCALFAALAATARWRFGPSLLALGLVAAYAPGSEVVQGTLLADRAGDWRDVLADLVGVAAGWWLADRAPRRR